jgi:hypothetical protein
VPLIESPKYFAHPGTGRVSLRGTSTRRCRSAQRFAQPLCAVPRRYFQCQGFLVPECLPVLASVTEGKSQGLSHIAFLQASAFAPDDPRRPCESRERDILGNAGTLGPRERGGHGVEIPNHSSEQIEFLIPLTPHGPENFRRLRGFGRTSASSSPLEYLPQDRNQILSAKLTAESSQNHRFGSRRVCPNCLDRLSKIQHKHLKNNEKDRRILPQEPIALPLARRATANFWDSNLWIRRQARPGSSIFRNALLPA